MTQEQINKGRIAISERCGWTMLSTNHKGALMGFAPLIPEMDECQWLAVPNYHNSLDAMHEAEEALWYGDLKRLHTDAVLYDEWCRYRSMLANNIHATAPQRFEAMLRVIGAWQEDAS